MGVNGAFAGPLDDGTQLLATLQVERATQWQAIDRDASLLVFLADAVDGFADDVYFYAVFALALTEVVNILFTASPFFIRDNVEYLHADVVFFLLFICIMFAKVLNIQ